MIKTIDVVKQTGSIDLSILTKLIEKTEYNLNGFTMLYEIVKDVMDTSVVDAELENVDFSICSSNFVNDILDQTGRLGNVLLQGEDSKYRYYITIKMLYEEDEDEDFLLDDISEMETPEQAVCVIIRIDKDQSLSISNFNFDNKSWENVDVCKEFGYTKKQAKMIVDNKAEDSVKILLLLLYHDAIGQISDDGFQKLYSESRPLLYLYEKTNGYMDLQILDNKKLGLSFNPDCTGAVVTYSDGMFQMNGYIIGKSLFTAFETDNMDTVFTWIHAMYASSSEEHIGIFPLSSQAFATITVYDDIQYSYFDKREKGEITEEEETILKMVLEKLDEVFEDEEVSD